MDQSQHGQSEHIFSLFGGYNNILKRKGFVLEVGSLDGSLFSNAAPFFNAGWSGICIEPDDVSFAKLHELYLTNNVVQTMNICVIPDDPTLVTFYMSHPDSPDHWHGVSTLDKTFADRYSVDGTKEFIKLTKLGLPLHILFTSFINQQIDYMTMDCECFDEKIILGTDFNIFRPKVIQSEFQYDMEIENVEMTKRAFQYLTDNGYTVKHIPDSRDILAIDMTNCDDLNLTDYNLMNG